jgi:C4-dicarboxylate-specific signal transduction histidine kinase
MDAETQASPATTFDLSAFVRGLTHEVANPLNAIAMNCELLRMIAARGEPERMREALDRILAACARSGGLMRALQRFGSALRRQPPSSVAVHELIDGAVRSLTSEYSGRLPQVEIAGADAGVHVDRSAIERALTALLRNASEAGAERVEITTSRQDGRVVIDVRDNGEGFAREDRDKFDAPFYSTHRTPSNMGLGLTLAREVLRVNDGSLRIVDARQGAHVQVVLRAEG